MPRARGTLLAACLVLLAQPATALRINSASDAALTGAIVEDFDLYADAEFASQTFLNGTDGFTVVALSGQMQLDSQYCASFGTSGACIDTYSATSGINDNFDVVFEGEGVTAFGFDITALDTDWVIETFDTDDNLISSYVLASQSPGLTGFNRRGYFGATESAPIQYFQVRSSSGDRALIDNFAYVPFVATPEPSTAVLVGFGLVGLARRRR